MDIQKISVILPVYNVEKFLPQAIESVINQTYKNLEIICVDDCTSDNSAEIIKNYMQKDDRIKLLRHDYNKGLAEARNTGLENSKGDYIFFLDSDDYLAEKDILEKLYKIIIEDKSDIVTCKAKSFTAEEDARTNKTVNNYNADYSTPCKFKKLQISKKNYYTFYDPIFHTAWGRLYKSEFLKKNKITFVKKNLVCEDEGFFIKVFVNFPFISYTDDIGIMYRIRKDSLISLANENEETKKDKKRQYKEVVADAFEYIKNRYDKKTADKMIKKIKYSLDLYETIKIPFLFEYKWNYSKKQISLFGINLFRQKIKRNFKIYKILGIPCYKKETISSPPP